MRLLLEWYRAEIVDASDSENRRRVRVRVKGLMEGIPVGFLPWAKPMSLTPSVKGGSDYPPVKGQKVWVRFAEGDINDAYWMGGVIEEKADLPSKNKAGRFIIYQSPNKGITITVDETTEDIEIKTKNYNTTLGKLIDLFLQHGHEYLIPAGTGVMSAIPNKAGITTSPLFLATDIATADFNLGDL